MGVGTMGEERSGVETGCLAGPPGAEPAVASPLQAIIGNYAVPILEEKQVWGTNDRRARRTWTPLTWHA